MCLNLVSESRKPEITIIDTQSDLLQIAFRIEIALFLRDRHRSTQHTCHKYPKYSVNLTTNHVCPKFGTNSILQPKDVS